MEYRRVRGRKRGSEKRGMVVVLAFTLASLEKLPCWRSIFGGKFFKNPADVNYLYRTAHFNIRAGSYGQWTIIVIVSHKLLWKKKKASETRGRFYCALNSICWSKFNSLRASSPFWGIWWKVDAREARERRRESEGGARGSLRSPK